MFKKLTSQKNQRSTTSIYIKSVIFFSVVYIIYMQLKWSNREARCDMSYSIKQHVAQNVTEFTWWCNSAVRKTKTVGRSVRRV